MKWICRLAIAAAAMTGFMYRNAHRARKKHAIVELSGQADFTPFVLLFISDIHRRKLNTADFQDNVDLVVIGGDFVERGVPLSRIRGNLHVLGQLAPVYYVFGNNDREIGEKKLLELFDEFHVKVLDDEAISLFGNPQLKLVGMDYFAFRKNSLAAAFKMVEPEDSVIFVCHTPFIFEKVKARYPVSLLLAGHTHGGQIRFGPFGVFEPGSLTQERGVTQLISNGFGTTSLPLRLGAEAQFHVLEICPAKMVQHHLAQSPPMG